MLKKLFNFRSAYSLFRSGLKYMSKMRKVSATLELLGSHYESISLGLDEIWSDEKMRSDEKLKSNLNLSSEEEVK